MNPIIFAITTEKISLLSKLIDRNPNGMISSCFGHVEENTNPSPCKQDFAVKLALDITNLKLLDIIINDNPSIFTLDSFFNVVVHLSKIYWPEALETIF